MNGYPYNYSSAPGTGIVAANSPDLALATKLLVGKEEQSEGYDVTRWLLAIVRGSSVLVQGAYDHTSWIGYVTTDVPVEQATHVELPVACTQPGTPPELLDRVLLLVDDPVAGTPGDATGRPSVEEVALLIRARTKDSGGREVGTFDEDTRPTGAEVELQIDAAYALVCTRLPAIDSLDASLHPAVSSLVAYRAALRIEKSYFPEQVRSDRSAYDQLYQEYTDDLAALLSSIEAGGGGELVADTGIGSLPVGSWTSMPHSWLPDPLLLDPDLARP